MTLRFLDSVENRVDRTIVHLENERSGTGLRFASEYLAVLEVLLTNPRFYPRVEDPMPTREIRNALVLRGSYRIVYEVDSAGVLVIDVLHSHRRPGTWHRSLSEVE